MDFSKAFDKVNYWKLFKQLLDDGINDSFVALLAFWYSGAVVSGFFTTCAPSLITVTLHYNVR